MTARYHLDSNVLLRFLTGEPPDMFKAASRLIEEAERGEVILELSPLVVAETAFTLESFYEQPRRKVASTLREFLERSGVRTWDKDRMLNALGRVEEKGVHLVDGYLAACASESGVPVASFDADLGKFKDVRRFNPMESA